MHDISLDVNHARMCLFGVITLKFNTKPLYPPKLSTFGPKLDLFFIRLKMLNNELKSKLPLIIIVAP